MADLTQVELPNGVTYDIKDSTKLPLAGGTMSGQIKTSFKSSVATGSQQADASTIPNLCNELRYSSGVMGSVSISTAYTKDGVTVSACWYNFLWIPHRSGGVNGSASGDNCDYGSLFLSGMTSSGCYLIRFYNGNISELHDLYKDTNTTYTLGTSSNTVTLTPSSGSAQSITVPYATSAGSATTATTVNQLNGFAATSSQTWGNQTGTFVHGENDSTGGSWAFRRDNPSSGQVSMILDGTVYIKEGGVNVSDAIKSITRSGTTFTYTTLWGNTGTFTQQDNDTKNTAGSTDTSSKIFLIGATSQTANPQTYSQDTAYVGTDGCLYSGGSKVLTSHQDISGKVNKSGDTMTGALNFANGTANKMGDDAQVGDHNKAGSFGVQGLNGATTITLLKQGVTWGNSEGGSIQYNATTKSLDFLFT